MSEHNKTQDQWKSLLSEESYKVTRESATERPFTGKYWDFDEKGSYLCICCQEPLFKSNTKFDAGCGWPSFFLPVNNEAILEVNDSSLGMSRTEVKCSKCDAHLGHVFEDGPRSFGGERYCINSASLNFEEESI